MHAPQSESRHAPTHPRLWIEGVSSSSKWLAISELEHILFGMDWVALVGGSPSQLAKKYIRLYRASLHTAFNSQSTVVGLATEVPPASAEVIAYSAADLFADAYQAETAACLIVMDQGECWMVAAHEGRVLVQTDRWFEDITQAMQAIEAIEQRFPQLRTHTYHLGEQSVMPGWACSPGAQAARLVRSKRFAGRAKPVVIVLSIVAIMLAYLWISHVQHEPSATQGEMSANAQYQQWQDILARQPVHGDQEIFNLVAAWNQVPVFPGGWRLARIDCQPETSRWRCMAVFHRAQALATAESLIQSLPAGWRPDFIPLDQASVTFSPGALPQRLDVSKTTSTARWMSHLQKIRIAFEHIQVGPAVSMLQQHETLNHVVSMPGDVPTMPSWSKRSLHIRGPLRSIALLKEWDVQGWWRQVSLELRDGDQGAPGKSRFVLTLNGEMYETKN